MFCKYKHIFGKEKEGIHSYRVFDIAIVDVIGTIIVALMLGMIFKWNIVLTILIAFLTGIVLHRLFCVNTTINKIIFGVV